MILEVGLTLKNSIRLKKNLEGTNALAYFGTASEKGFNETGTMSEGLSETDGQPRRNGRSEIKVMKSFCPYLQNSEKATF